jgi:murein DD-endopeptidase MepM/ murein hydrolase activator NlpD
MRTFARLLVATLMATAAWFPATTQQTQAIYCYPGDPPDVYQACLAYNQGIGQQVTNQRQLQSIQRQIKDTVSAINQIDSLIGSLKRQIQAQEDLIARTQAAIDDLNRKIRFGQAALIELNAHVTVRDQILEQRLRYIDSHGSVNYMELVLTSSSINQLLNRLVGAQEVAASDRKLLTGLQQEHLQVGLANAALDQQRTQVQTLLMQQQATEADMKDNLATQAAALVLEQQLAQQLSAQYAKVQAERAAIDAQVAKLAQSYQAAARKAGGGSGVFEWPLPACNFSCITQGFGCSTFYLEVYDPACPYPHKIHTGVDIAGPYGTPIVAADTGVVYLYPGSIGYGNLLVMIHGNGYETYYGHTSRYAPGLRTGMIVARGTTIAFEGSTGWSTGPHLHFEIRINGVYKDPCIWLGC